MTRDLTKEQFYQEVANVVVRHRLNDDDVIATMILLHCFRLTLAPDVQLVDAPKVLELYPLTRADVADFIANAFGPNRKLRSFPQHWRAEFEGRALFEIASRIAPEWQTRVDHVVTLLQLEELIVGVVADD